MVTEATYYHVMKLLREATALNLDGDNDLLELGNDAIDILIDALDGNDRRQLVNAMGVLEQIGARHANRAIPSLFALQYHVHPWVRMSSAKAIGILGSASDVDSLVQWLHAESEVLVQVWIVISLGRLGSVQAVDPLIAALKCANCSTLTYTIIRALGDLGDVRAAPVIAPYLHDEDSHVRKDAQDALNKLHGLEHKEGNNGR